MSLYLKSEEDTMNDYETMYTRTIPKRIQTISIPKKGDVNKGISIHITMLLHHWTKIHDLMLFHGSLPLELNQDLQQWMRLWLNITRRWYVLLLYYGCIFFCVLINHINTRTHTRTHTHRCWFLWFTGTFHRRNGFYTVQAVCAIALHLPYT